MGYAGGTTQAPTYEDLGDHSEAIQVDFDPARVRYADLLERFWAFHRPTRPAYSRQYRSAILYADEAQHRLARENREAQAARLGETIHTSLEPLRQFWLAEDYHQKYRLQGHPEWLALFDGLDARALVDSTLAARLNGFLAGRGSPEDLAAEIDRYGLDPSQRARLLELVSGANAAAVLSR